MSDMNEFSEMDSKEDDTNCPTIIKFTQKSTDPESESTTTWNRTGSNATSRNSSVKHPDDFVVSWHNLDYVVRPSWFSNSRKPILNCLNGNFESGQLTAILGPSGSGKSTLIDCLLGKKPSSNLRGGTRLNFGSASIEEERRRKRPLRIALIPQEDHLLDSFTVTETFMFASKIKNAHLKYEPNTKEPFNHKANVQKVIKQLNLVSCATQKCSELSGGQYKRVSIGQELLSRPDIMILDEPTSGLDSVTCYQTIKALRELIDTSAYPLAIVATIHQPDLEVFSLFHKAYVLATGGRAIYEGSTDRIIESVNLGLELLNLRSKQSFWSLTTAGHQVDSAQLEGLRRQLDQKWCNPAKLIVEVAANEYGHGIVSAMSEIHKTSYVNDDQLKNSTETIGTEISRPLCSKSNLALSVQSLVTNSSVCTAPTYDYSRNDPANRRPDLDKLLNLNSSNINQRRSLWVHTKHIALHANRSWKSIIRDPMLFTIMLALHFLVPLLISYSFYSTHKSDACPRIGPLDVINEAYREGSILDDLNIEIRSAFENIGYMFFQIYVIIFAAVCVTSLTYPIVMHVLLKEHRNGWYSLVSYFLGRTLADLPVPTLNVVIAIAISYHLTGQPLSAYGWRFISVASLTVLATLVAQTQGLMFGAMLMNAPQSAVFVAPASTAPLVVVSGFLLRIKSLPWILQILSKFSYFTHLLNGFIISRYGFNRCPCDESIFSDQDVPKIPAQSKAVIDLWVESYASEYGQNITDVGQANVRVDLIGKLVDTISLAKTFGFKISNCSQVKPFTMLDYELNDTDLTLCFVALFLMLFVFRWLTFMVLRWKINTSL